ncbi:MULTISPECIES: glycosyltransferase [Leclercia]|uniref:glycosyltransferase n=1 Tax=Leclercia TaxID=83654 RepID=UPI00254B1F2A|nr:glycosyltransferase [Leclercia adecarboxylata]
MMKVLHIVGNKIESSNGIGRLLPEMIVMQNNYSSDMESSLYCINDTYENASFEVINYNEMNDSLIDNFDIFIFHGLYFYRYITFAKKIRSRNKPYLIKPHSSLITHAQKKSLIKKYLANLLFFKGFVKHANAVIFTNEDEAKNSVQWNDNILYEGNGLQSIQTKEVRLRKKNSPYKFVYLSRIDFSHKGTDILLDALMLLKESNKIDNLDLAIYGKGSPEEENELVRRINQLNFKDVSFKGPIFGQQKNDMFYEKDIFILTSRYEGFPMAILEALDSGLPCLVTQGVNMTSIINNHHVGWECQTTPQSVAELILYVMNIDEEVLNNMTTKSREYIINQHDWSALVKYSESIYADVYKRVV